MFICKFVEHFMRIHFLTRQLMISPISSRSKYLYHTHCTHLPWAVEAACWAA